MASVASPPPPPPPLPLARDLSDMLGEQPEAPLRKRKRSPTPPYGGVRESKNIKERERRLLIDRLFTDLHQQLPELDGIKASRQEILQESIRCIRALRKELGNSTAPADGELVFSLWPGRASPRRPSPASSVLGICARLSKPHRSLQLRIPAGSHGIRAQEHRNQDSQGDGHDGHSNAEHCRRHLERVGRVRRTGD